MDRVLILALVCVLAAEGGFGFLAGLCGLGGYGDYLAAVAIAVGFARLLPGVHP
jgi:hypothetical protein